MFSKPMKQPQYILLLVIAFVLTACKVDDSINPELIGSWENTSVRYTFKSDYSFAQENLRKGDSTNLVVVDSLFGTYVLDNKRSNVTFKPIGYRIDSTGEIITQGLNDQTWEYSIEGNTLNYESPTTLGELERVEE